MAKAKVKVTKNGPYIVSGNPTMKEEEIGLNQEGASWNYIEIKVFGQKDNVALCRCGKSSHAPYCDTTHMKTGFDGTCTASFEPILAEAEAMVGKNYTLYDNDKYCAFARFCDAGDRVWNLIEEESEEAEALAIREALNCPAGRLMIQDNKTKKFLDIKSEPTIVVLEDPAINSSGPLYLKGKIEVVGENNKSYEIRARQTLCRCGASSNKPFCDGTHASIHFNDGDLRPRKINR